MVLNAVGRCCPNPVQPDHTSSLWARYGVTPILQGVNMRVDKGEIVGLIGRCSGVRLQVPPSGFCGPSRAERNQSRR
jgi:hypothetical protein